MEQPFLSLANGVRMPALGFGIYEIPAGPVCETSVLDALAAGYRHLDTAVAYSNEASVGAALKRSGISREEIFITAKTGWDQSPENCREAFETSLRNFGTEYADLLLVHWPLEDAALPAQWATLEALYQEGKCRAIGVSNFTIPRLQKVLLPAARILPMVNQIELHVFNQQRELCAFCKEKGIQVEAYSPLARSQRIDHPELVWIARECGRTPAQVMLRWLIQAGYVVIPKSTHKERIVENFATLGFDLSQEAMDALSKLDEALFTQAWRPGNFY